MAEVIIYYHLYNKKFGTVDVSPQPVGADIPVVAPAKPKINLSTVFLRLSEFSALLGIALILFFYTPKVLAWGQNLVGTATQNYNLNSTEVQNLKMTAKAARQTYQPPFDPLLSPVNRLIIPSIGVDGEIQEATLDNYEAALKKGVWRVSNFGAPDANNMPIILAAHRYGYLAWTDLFRRQNSFYNLPKIKVGDTVEIDWGQRKYTYGVYTTEEGTQITDYSADLILYTCESLTGDERFFVYAHLIQM